MRLLVDFLDHHPHGFYAHSVYSGEKSFDPLPHIVLFILTYQSPNPIAYLTASGNASTFVVEGTRLCMFFTGGDPAVPAGNLERY